MEYNLTKALFLSTKFNVFLEKNQYFLLVLVELTLTILRGGVIF